MNKFLGTIMGMTMMAQASLAGGNGEGVTPPNYPETYISCTNSNIHGVIAPALEQPTRAFSLEIRDQAGRVEVGTYDNDTEMVAVGFFTRKLVEDFGSGSWNGAHVEVEPFDGNQGQVSVLTPGGQVEIQISRDDLKLGSTGHFPLSLLVTVDEAPAVIKGQRGPIGGSVCKLSPAIISALLGL